MAVEFVIKTKNKLSVIWTDENTLIKYNIGSIVPSISKFNDLSVDDLEQIIDKIKECKNEKI